MRRDARHVSSAPLLLLSIYARCCRSSPPPASRSCHNVWNGCPVPAYPPSFPHHARLSPVSSCPVRPRSELRVRPPPPANPPHYPATTKQPGKVAGDVVFVLTQKENDTFQRKAATFC